MNISFEGKRILVTGAGRGIGKGICIRLAECGAQVIALSKSDENLSELKKQIPSMETVCVDLSDWNATRLAVANLTTRPIHGLVNNAAYASLGSFFDVIPEDFDKSFDVNVKAVCNVSQVVAKEMVQRKEGGSIVNISSQASKAALKDHTVYCATKGALDAMSRVMALELGPHNIRINCVNPTVIMTDMGRLGWSDPAIAQPMLDKIPLGRFGEVSEVVDAVVFLLSDQSAMINGVQLPIDGGFLAC